MIYEFECQKCKEVQEHLVPMGQHTEEKCQKCGASPKKLKRVLSAHAAMKGSWSKWQI